MKIAITGTQSWGPHAEAAEEIIAGFIRKLPRNSIIITGGLEDGPEIWANRYAKAYKFHVTEFQPQQVKGAAHYVRNFSMRDKNISENADRLFCFLYANSEPEAEIANLMTVVKLNHVAHTIYTFAPDEEDETKLKMVNRDNVEAKEMLPREEVKVGTGRSKGDSKPVRKAQSTKSRRKSTQRTTTRPAVRRRTGKPAKVVQGQKRVANRRPARKAVSSGTVVLTRNAVRQRDKRTDKGVRAKQGRDKTIVLRRI